jgi:DNA-binding PadR family transcriptional regulator
MPEKAPMTDAELSILSLVAEGARYGHEIQQLIDERGLREWVTIGFSSVYYLLNKLEQQNLISGDVRPGTRGPGRKVFEITAAGHGVLQTAVADLLRQPRSLGSGFELGLANIGALKPRQVYTTLQHHSKDLQNRLALVEKAWQRHQQADEPPPIHIHALYTHSIAVMRAELDWLNVFIGDWLVRYPNASDPATTDGQPAAPVNTSNNQVTQLHRRRPPAPDKILQKLKRPKPPTDEEA